MENGTGPGEGQRDKRGTSVPREKRLTLSIVLDIPCALGPV